MSEPPEEGEGVQTMADRAVFGMCELLGLLFGLPFGDDLYHGNSIGGRHWFYLAIGLLFAGAGPMFPWIRTRTWIPESASASLSRAALDARIWIAALLMLFLYVVGPEIYQRAVAPRIVPPSAVIDSSSGDVTANAAPSHATQPPSAAPKLSQPYLLDANMMRVLLPPIAALRPQLSQLLLTMAQDISAQGNMRQFKSLFERAGIRVDVEGQQPTGPEQSGVMLAVRDINNPPQIALQLSGLMHEVGFEMKIVPLVTTGGSKEDFSIFIGPPPL